MLVEFTVGNYRSFKERKTLSLEALDITSKPSSIDESNVFSVNEDLKLLKAVSIYGANASGKSNLISAMRFMRSLVLSSSKETQIGDQIKVEQHKLCLSTKDSHSFFEIVFLVEGRQYRYGFEVNAQRVHSEWLYRFGTIREVSLFLRKDNSIKTSRRDFKEGRGLEDRTRPNALFLSVVAQFNGTIASKVLNWFSELTIISGIGDPSDLMFLDAPVEHEGFRKVLARFIKALDIGIDGIEVKKVPLWPLGGVESKYQEHVDIFMKAVAPEINPSALERTRILTIHKVYDNAGNVVGSEVFDLETHESDGTKRLFAIANPVLRSLLLGRVLIIDEIDARLHANLILEIIRLFNSPNKEGLHGQLVFTTHNTNILSADLMRRDQIWFVEKSNQGASDLYSLIELREGNKVVRNDASFEKDYVTGRYGGIPLIGNLRLLLEDEVETTSVTE